MPTEVAEAIRLAAEARRRSDVRRPTMALAVGIAAPRQKPMLACTGRCLQYQSDLLLIPSGTKVTFS
jgi:hypothetical protein